MTSTVNHDSIVCHARSINDRDAFWAEQARLVDWETPPQTVCDDSRLPFAHWFKGGTTNLCHNAVDRHVAARGDQDALVWISTEVNETRRYSYAQLQQEVMTTAAMLRSMGVQRGDRVLIYMPMVPEAAFAMLACARIGAIHSVVFGGFAAQALATRIEDAEPRVIVSCDAGMRGGRSIPYRPLLAQALSLSRHVPEAVLDLDRGLASDADTGLTGWPASSPRHDFAALRAQHLQAQVPVTWLESGEPSYILYTSGTTGKPKGVQRDTGGYAVALASSMRLVYNTQPGERMFTTSDIGWVVGHSYIIYGPLINGMTTVMYEGTPLQPDPGIWWRICEQERISTMFSAPTAIRVLRKTGTDPIKACDLSRLRQVFCAGEPMDETSHDWLQQALGIPVIDHYWQTETGWPMLSLLTGVEPPKVQLGSPGLPVYGFDVRLFRDDGTEAGPGEKAIVGVVPPLPPGCLSTLWRDDKRFVDTYFSLFSDRLVYSSFDWGIRDADGYYRILGRTDDVINVAGHRLGTREIEECLLSHPDVAEVAVVGLTDALKGQVPVATVVPKGHVLQGSPEERAALQSRLQQHVRERLGSIAHIQNVYVLGGLPKTRSGKVLRRAIGAVLEGRPTGDLTTLEDATPLTQLQEQMLPR
ncbi:propionate--CoA ligase [Amphibiibacter pelophylacis]|uniref:Propionate--CoA ligase n=1 Tax=Amphibiibacter pelophylacis TaxID=1799477 RepID=A0ACC6P0E4_9BURK